jgi:hypothetical protein
MYYTYLLVDPRTAAPFYVGKGAKERMYHHDKRSHNRKVRERVAEINALGLKVIYEKWIESEDEYYCYWMETYLIDYFGRNNLLNFSAGGGGPRVFIFNRNRGLRKGERHHNWGRVASEETRRKIGAAHTGEKHWNFGGHHSEATRAKLRLAWQTRPRRPKKPKVIKPRKDISGENNPFFGQTHSAEVIARLSAVRKGRPSNRLGAKLSEESKLKLRLAKLGKKRAPFSEETLKRMSEAKLGDKNPMFGKLKVT